jgi:molybdopterin-containing oxidoreductase family iron-sulfur binding subunit
MTQNQDREKDMTDIRPEKEAIEPSPLLSPLVTALDRVHDTTNDDDHSSAVESGDSNKPRSISRRRLFGTVSAVGLGAALGARVLENPSGASAAVHTAAVTITKKKPLSQWMMIVDLRSCDGCKACTASCQYYHYLPKDIEWIKVYDMVDADGQKYYLPRLCQMCEDPPCQAVCPVGATFRTDEGMVLIDQNVCIGCRTCMAACPYESRYFNTTAAPKVPRQPFPTTPEWPVPQRTETVGKCIWCAARLPQGMLPECVTNCPMGVIYMGDLTTDVAVNGKNEVVKISEFLRENDAVRLKEELGTNPRVYYIPGHGQDLSA